MEKRRTVTKTDEEIEEEEMTFFERMREAKELKLIEKENQAVYDLTVKLANQEGLTFDQVVECYK